MRSAASPSVQTALQPAVLRIIIIGEGGGATLSRNRKERDSSREGRRITTPFLTMAEKEAKFYNDQPQILNRRARVRGVRS